MGGREGLKRRSSLRIRRAEGRSDDDDNMSDEETSRKPRRRVSFAGVKTVADYDGDTGVINPVHQEQPMIFGNSHSDTSLEVNRSTHNEKSETGPTDHTAKADLDTVVIRENLEVLQKVQQEEDDDTMLMMTGLIAKPLSGSGPVMEQGAFTATHMSSLAMDCSSGSALLIERTTTSQSIILDDAGNVTSIVAGSDPHAVDISILSEEDMSMADSEMVSPSEIPSMNGEKRNPNAAGEAVQERISFNQRKNATAEKSKIICDENMEISSRNTTENNASCSAAPDFDPSTDRNDDNVMETVNENIASVGSDGPQHPKTGLTLLGQSADQLLTEVSMLALDSTQTESSNVRLHENTSVWTAGDSTHQSASSSRYPLRNKNAGGQKKGFISDASMVLDSTRPTTDTAPKLQNGTLNKGDRNSMEEPVVKKSKIIDHEPPATGTKDSTKNDTSDPGPGEESEDVFDAAWSEVSEKLSLDVTAMLDKLKIEDVDVREKVITIRDSLLKEFVGQIIPGAEKAKNRLQSAKAKAKNKALVRFLDDTQTGDDSLKQRYKNAVEQVKADWLNNYYTALLQKMMATVKEHYVAELSERIDFSKNRKWELTILRKLRESRLKRIKELEDCNVDDVERYQELQRASVQVPEKVRAEEWRKKAEQIDKIAQDQLRVVPLLPRWLESLKMAFRTDYEQRKERRDYLRAQRDMRIRGMVVPKILKDNPDIALVEMWLFHFTLHYQDNKLQLITLASSRPAPYTEVCKQRLWQPFHDQLIVQLNLPRLTELYPSRDRDGKVLLSRLAALLQHAKTLFQYLHGVFKRAICSSFEGNRFLVKNIIGDLLFAFEVPFVVGMTLPQFKLLQIPGVIPMDKVEQVWNKYDGSLVKLADITEEIDDMNRMVFRRNLPI